MVDQGAADCMAARGRRPARVLVLEQWRSFRRAVEGYRSPGRWRARRRRREGWEVDGFLGLWFQLGPAS